MTRTAVQWVLLSSWFAVVGCADREIEPTRDAVTVTVSQVAPIGGGNALTLPAQRHLLRFAPSTWLLAVQQDTAGQQGLGLFRSDDDGRSFHYYKPIQGDASERDTADLVTVGNDVAMVYSYEGPTLGGSTRHDVFFQWWRASGSDWVPQSPVRIFDSVSTATAYYRAEIASDSVGRLWIHAFLLNPDGSAAARIAVSSDGGNTFQIQPDLGSFPTRGGGRLLSLGARMLFIWDGQDGSSPARFRTRDDAAPVGSWNATQVAFSEGIYHGAALSAVADGQGGMHLVYKDKNSVLRYRRFDGAGFGAALEVEAQGDWELQGAATRIGGDLWIFYNRVISTNVYDEIRVRQLAGGANTLGAPTVLDSTRSFKGYPAAVDTLPTGTAVVPCLFGVTPTADDSGQLQLYSATVGSSAPPVVDAAVPIDLARPAPPRDLSTTTTPPPVDLAASSAAFADDFSRNIPPDNGLGASWSVVAGDWWANGRANSDLDGTNLISENATRCRDCTVQARVLTFGTEGGVYLRAPTPTSPSDGRYDLVLLPNGHVQIRRVRSGAVSVLADGASGAASLDDWVGLALSASGDSPVTLTARVDGVTVLTATDTSSAAPGAGYAGLWTLHAGVWFDDFALSGSTPPTGGGGGGAPVDLGVPVDLATRPVDLASPPHDLSSPPPSSVVFTDDFARSIPPDNGLGASWSVGAGDWWANGRANSDLDGTNLVGENVARCRDCTVQARVVTFGTEGGVFARAPAPTSPDHYDLVLLPSAHVQIRRVRNGAATVLADGAAGVAALDDWVTLALSTSGEAPVALTARVNGATVLTASDDSSAALGAGWAGLWTLHAGVWFDDFALSGSGASSAPPPPQPPPPPPPPPAMSCGYGATLLSSGACGMADLEVNVSLLASETYVDTQTFQSSDCEVVESCIGTGTHRLLNFSLGVRNVGAYDLVLGDPTLDPSHFVYMPCHNHYHFLGFADYRLLDARGVEVSTGQKESFCVGDTVSGPTPPRYSCEYQGLSVGWTDVYSAGTACQYLDVTGLPSGSYTLEAVINPDRVFLESSYDNNTGRVSVELP
jgi:hypothetical protein